MLCHTATKTERCSQSTGRSGCGYDQQPSNECTLFGKFPILPALGFLLLYDKFMMQSYQKGGEHHYMVVFHVFVCIV